MIVGLHLYGLGFLEKNCMGPNFGSYQQFFRPKPKFEIQIENALVQVRIRHCYQSLDKDVLVVVWFVVKVMIGELNFLNQMMCHQ